MPIPAVTGIIALLKAAPALGAKMLVFVGATHAAQVVLKLLAGLGLSYATIGLALPELQTFIQSQLGGLPADAYNVLALCGVDVAVTIVLSALAVRMSTRVVLRAVGA